MNEFTTCIGDIHHHVSDDTLPHRAINRAAPINHHAECGPRYYPDEWDVGGLMVVAHYLYSIILRMGVIGEARFIA